MHSPGILAHSAAEVAHLLQQTILAYPPSEPSRELDRGSGRVPPRIGMYIYAFGYIGLTHLQEVLALQQQQARQNTYLLLGDILINQQLIHEQVLVTMLLVQMIDRITAQPMVQNLLLGEYLVASGLISPRALARILQQQIRLRQHGLHASLGDLLLQNHLLDEQLLVDALSSHAYARNRQFTEFT